MLCLRLLTSNVSAYVVLTSSLRCNVSRAENNNRGGKENHTRTIYFNGTEPLYKHTVLMLCLRLLARERLRCPYVILTLQRKQNREQLRRTKTNKKETTRTQTILT